MLSARLGGPSSHPVGRASSGGQALLAHCVSVAGAEQLEGAPWTRERKRRPRLQAPPAVHHTLHHWGCEESSSNSGGEDLSSPAGREATQTVSASAGVPPKAASAKEGLSLGGKESSQRTLAGPGRPQAAPENLQHLSFLVRPQLLLPSRRKQPALGENIASSRGRSS
ncbi:hypothetical protein NDU88_005991 [Pleurodeles waltl]|uniref:Uncharacterized protein n=1 Tax=Pleurodeles waltl TaxID=8319 RepID=A0AAV7LMQ4_PLEWA|nr:hypothetical protein NDU88_005991 [Pleurodeles waltl]